MLTFSVLASGSSGNAIYIATETTRILLDAGISTKQISTRLQSLSGPSVAALDAVLITHEHSDHVRGLKQTLKQSSAPVYMTEGTYHQVKTHVKEVRPETDVQYVTAGQVFTIGDITVTPFAVSHDAEEPVAFRFDAGTSSVAVVTDLGYMSDTIKTTLRGCENFVLEANHDVGMLRAGPYPWHLKRRILGDKGHLSNVDAALDLADILGTDRVSVYLAHLSDENNQPDLAELTVQSVLTEVSAHFGEQVDLFRTSRHAPTALHPVPITS